MTTRILGIDPGSQATGFGVVECEGSRLRHVAHGVLRPPREGGLAPRLAAIHAGIAEVIQTHAPALAVVEQVFVSVSPRSALVLGQARGAALTALAQGGLAVDELSPSEIKRAVVGTGRAEKKQVQEMVRRLLALERAPASDAADALAAAICRAHVGDADRAQLFRRSPGRGRGRSRAARFVVRRQ